MEIIKKGIEMYLEIDTFSAYNANYDASCPDDGCVCDDCVDGG